MTIVATREQDERLLAALRLMCEGKTPYRAAKILGWDISNLKRAAKKVVAADLEHDDPAAVLPFYPEILL